MMRIPPGRQMVEIGDGTIRHWYRQLAHLPPPSKKKNLKKHKLLF